MKVYEFNIPSGTLEVCILEECPSSFPESPSRRIYLYPEEGIDLECRVVEGNDRLARATLEVEACLSYLFGAVRGIPTCALSVRYEGALLEIPKFCTPPGVINVPLPKCKYKFTKTEYFDGGMPEALTTVLTDFTSRIVEVKKEAPYPLPLLRRTRVVAGLADAVRAIAYYRESDHYRAISTDRHECVDSIAPLAYILLNGEERVSIVTARGEYVFFKDEDGLYARIPVSQVP